jgi:hypothetical protein
VSDDDLTKKARELAHGHLPCRFMPESFQHHMDCDALTIAIAAFGREQREAGARAMRESAAVQLESWPVAEAMRFAERIRGLPASPPSDPRPGDGMREHRNRVVDQFFRDIDEARNAGYALGEPSQTCPLCERSGWVPKDVEAKPCSDPDCGWCEGAARQSAALRATQPDPRPGAETVPGEPSLLDIMREARTELRKAGIVVDAAAGTITQAPQAEARHECPSCDADYVHPGSGRLLASTPIPQAEARPYPDGVSPAGQTCVERCDQYPLCSHATAGEARAGEGTCVCGNPRCKPAGPAKTEGTR